MANMKDTAAGAASSATPNVQAGAATTVEAFANEVSAISVLSHMGLGLAGAGEAAGASLSVPAPFANRIVLVDDMRIAGTTHIVGIDDLVAGLSIDQELAFEREPANLHDTWAIRVLANGAFLGYVPCDQNEILARMMDGGKRIGAKVIDKEKIGNWNKIHMEVFLDD